METSHIVRYILTAFLLFNVWWGSWWAVPLCLTLLVVLVEMASIMLAELCKQAEQLIRLQKGLE